MTQNRNPRLPGTEAALADHARQLRELTRGPGDHVYVGTYPGDPFTTPESPPFKNGWRNIGGNKAPVSFYIDKWQKVHIRGGATGGLVGTVIFTLPPGYRPDYTAPFTCPLDVGDRYATIEVTHTGDVVLLAVGP